MGFQSPRRSDNEMSALNEYWRQKQADASGGGAGGALGSLIGMGLGAALAPFTGGLSLAAGAAIGGGLGGLAGSYMTGGDTLTSLTYAAQGGFSGYGLGSGIMAGQNSAALMAKQTALMDAQINLLGGAYPSNPTSIPSSQIYIGNGSDGSSPRWVPNVIGVP